MDGLQFDVLPTITTQTTKLPKIRYTRSRSSGSKNRSIPPRLVLTIPISFLTMQGIKIPESTTFQAQIATRDDDGRQILALVPDKTGTIKVSLYKGGSLRIACGHVPRWGYDEADAEVVEVSVKAGGVLHIVMPKWAR